MSNRPLEVGCPTCSGTGSASFVRRGAWLNRHCPGLNGPVDSDGAPQTHELDNYRAKRKVRIEYKRPNEAVSPGQEFHFLAELESTAQDWLTLLVLVLDEGQESDGEMVRFDWRDSAHVARRWGEYGFQSAQLGELGQRIAAWLWG